MLCYFATLLYTPFIGTSNSTIHFVFDDPNCCRAPKIAFRYVFRAWKAATFENMLGVTCIHQTY